MKNYIRILAAAVVLLAVCFAFPMPVSAAQGDVLFEESFSLGIDNKWKAGAGANYLTTAEVTDGALHLVTTGNSAAKTSTYLLYEIPETVTAYTIYAEFKVAKFGDGETVAQRQRPLGIAFNLPDSADITWQAATFTGQADVNNVNLSGYQNGSSKEAYRYADSELQYALADNEWYAVEIKVDDNELLLQASVKKLTDEGWTDCWTANGKNATGVPGFGRYVGVLSRGNEVYIDNFKITNNTPEQTPVTDTSTVVSDTEPPVVSDTSKDSDTVTTATTPSDTSTVTPDKATSPSESGTDKAPETTVPEKSKGCGGFAAGGILLVIGSVGSAVILTRKRYF